MARPDYEEAVPERFRNIVEQQGLAEAVIYSGRRPSELPAEISEAGNGNGNGNGARPAEPAADNDAESQTG